MREPVIAIPSFPGSNGEVDNLKTLRRCGFKPFVFRWNDSLDKLRDVDGYFFGAGFSYEDRGRSGMVAARDPLFRFIHEEAARGKVVIGSCNGAQVLVESGLIPLGTELSMCLAHNALRRDDGSWSSPGFLNEWVWMTPACKRDRCATSDWSGAMHVPIAHGEGRFVTRDKDLLQELQKNDQIAFQYCDSTGTVSERPPVTPNGSTYAIAGICNPAGNVVAIMPHPERSPLGDPYFLSAKRWILSHPVSSQPASLTQQAASPVAVPMCEPMQTEIFIDTVITNNEERTVEQAARRYVPTLRLKQYRYVGLPTDASRELLSSLSFFNPHKEIAYVRKAGALHKWNADRKALEKASHSPLQGISILRTDEPDRGAGALTKGSRTGVCYDCRGVEERDLFVSTVCEVFCNPNASTLERF